MRDFCGVRRNHIVTRLKFATVGIRGIYRNVIKAHILIFCFVPEQIFVKTQNSGYTYLTHELAIWGVTTRR